MPVERFEAMYRDGDTPWEVGAPQGAVLRLVEDGRFTGRVLDVGCGTGENAILMARDGADVTGIDASALAVERAIARAAARGIAVRFEVGDVLRLPARSSADAFDAALDSGCFHVFNDDDRREYVASVRGVLRRGGLLWVLCFSEHEPAGWGPRRVTAAEIRLTFEGPFAVEHVEEATYDIARPGADSAAGRQPARAWLATLRAC